jgi:outer membrane lipoprotein-sorting protein
VDLEQVTISRLDDNVRNSPAAILGGKIEIEENFTVNNLSMQGDTEWIELESKQAESEFNTIRLGFHNSELTGMILLDNLGQRTQLNFFDVTRNQVMDTAMFEFSPPDGVDVIDTREQ